jgi:hypothetical protein
VFFFPVEQAGGSMTILQKNLRKESYLAIVPRYLKLLMPY